MVEKNINFDEVVNRENTESLKYDFKKRRGMPEDVLPLWVADMDFKTSSIVIDILKERVEHGIFGYTESKEEYFSAVSKWFEEKHNYEIKENWITKTPGVVVALAMAVKAYTDIGDAVLIQEPIYYPFTQVINDNKRVVVSNNLVLGDDNKYHIDFEDFEKKIIDNDIKLFLLCSPHNPVSRVWTKDELEKMGDICLKHGVIVVSDEIHSDFVYEGNVHTVFATIKPEFANISVICTSPAKTFNLAGMQISNIIISNHMLRRKFRKQVNAIGYSQVGTMGITACEAAYNYGDKWYKELLKYLQGNVEFTRNYIKKNIAQITMIEPEGTYLIWLDFRKLGLSREEQYNLIVKKARLWLDNGEIFGEGGRGFERINIACPRSVLKEALDRIKNAIYELEKSIVNYGAV